MEPVRQIGGRPVRALLVVRNPFVHDARVLRAAQTLRAIGCEPTVVAAIGADDSPRREVRSDIPVVRVGPPELLARALRGPVGRVRRARSAIRPDPDGGAAPAKAAGRGRARRGRLARMLVRWATALDFYLRAIAEARRLSPDLVHCNDYNTMWVGVACRLLLGSRIVYDSHELWPDRNLRPEARWWLLLCEALFVRVADRVVMTSPAHAEVMALRYRVPEPVVVRNIPEREPVAAAAPDSPGNGRAPVAAYVGILLPNRGLEQSIRALASLDGARLRLIGPIDDDYRAELEAIAGAVAVEERVEFVGSVPPTEVLGALTGADVGLALFQPGCLSHRLVLPNKLFEYALAGVPILGSDLPMIARFVREHGLGATVDPEDVEAIADALSRMLEPERNRELRAAAARAAEALDWRRERERLAAVYREALAGGHSQ